MTVAVISDVHGNAWALDAVLADARACGAVCNPGSVGLQPFRVAVARAAGREDWAMPLATGRPPE